MFNLLRQPCIYFSCFPRDTSLYFEGHATTTQHSDESFPPTATQCAQYPGTHDHGRRVQLRQHVPLMQNSLLNTLSDEPAEIHPVWKNNDIKAVSNNKFLQKFWSFERPNFLTVQTNSPGIVQVTFCYSPWKIAKSYHGPLDSLRPQQSRTPNPEHELLLTLRSR